MSRSASLPDVSVWFALTISGHSHHEAAREWFNGLAPAHEVFFCRISQTGLLRLVTTASVMAGYRRSPLSNSQALGMYREWLGLASVHWAEEPTNLDRTWSALASRSSASPKLWMDAYLAAFAINAGSCLVTCDKAMKQFTGTEVMVLG